MRVVVGALAASIPGILSMGALFVMVLYVFAIASTTLFAPIDPKNYGDLGLTFTSLYRIVMGDGWGDVVVPITNEHPWAWAYFMGFSLVGAIILLNLFIAVIVEGMNRMQTSELEDSREDEQEQLRDVLTELREPRQQVDRLEHSGGRD